MSQLTFYKYQATGNDFVMIDDRPERFDTNELSLVKALCDRRFGIGADGLILIRNFADCDFEMVYFNADGSQSLCGNGSRCAVEFARHLGILKHTQAIHFMAIDGLHQANIYPNNTIGIAMHDVTTVDHYGDDLFINTGSPHYIRFVASHQGAKVQEDGRTLRYAEPFGQPGTNVNFIEVMDNEAIFVRTYERGVEAETLSCGTGVTAASLAATTRGLNSPVQVHTLGGQLSVKFRQATDHHFKDIELIGPAKLVYQGSIDTRQLTDNIADRGVLV